MKTKSTEYTAKFMAHDPTVLDTKVNSNKQVCTFYEHPTLGEDDCIYVMIGERLADTEFFDLGDFYLGSDYEPTLIDGQIICKFEYEPEISNDDSVGLTVMETAVINYLDGCDEYDEKPYAHIVDISNATNLAMASLRGVLSSLIQKDKIELQHDFFRNGDTIIFKIL